jgi:hypothetical protein
MADNSLVIDPDSAHAFSLEQKRLALSAGVLGSFFGTGPNVPLYIAAFTITLLMLGGLSVLFLKTEMPPAEYWKIATPIITGALGFVFGRRG